jgi:mono/diheme cytochrome c family protein
MHRPAEILGALALIGLLTIPSSSSAQDAAAFYEENCSVCHTIGGGPQGGPDLKDVTRRRERDWLIRFLLNPDAFASDPAVVRMIKEADGLTMPATDGLTRELADAILTVIEQRSGAGEPAAPPSPPVTPADVARGRALFVGTERLSAAGPACVACHDAAGLAAPAGGRLGPDLTAVHARLGGQRGLTAWLGATPTPVMRAIYRSAPMTADESLALAAFFEDAAGRDVPRRSRLSRVVAGAVSGAVAVVALAAALGARRFRAVRRPLVQRARTSGAEVPGGRR